MTDAAKRAKGVYIGAPACFELELAIRQVCEAYGVYKGEAFSGCYLVGSALERPDWRDVDVRLLMDDALFAGHFPNAGSHWEHDAKWLLLTSAISQWLSAKTNLPVDFQFQPLSHANAKHPGKRSALGIRLSSGTR